MHSTTKMFLDKQFQGTMPPSWATGDTFFQKAKFIAAVAWSFVKQPTDPELYNCDLTFQETQVGITEGLMRGTTPDPTPFSLKVAELIKDLPKEELKK